MGLPLAEDRETGWRSYPFGKGPTARLAWFRIHASVLSVGATPHPVHDHPDEEILIMLDEDAELIIEEGHHPVERIETLRPGSFVYYPANARHTLHNAGERPCTYLILKWRSVEGHPVSPLPTSIVPFGDAFPDPETVDEKGYAHRRLFEQETGYLHKLHAHVTTMLPGAGYAPHVDGHDVALLVLTGEVETLGRRVGPHSFVFYPAGEPHGLRNPGEVPATYLVFEFHGGEKEQVKPPARPGGAWQRVRPYIRGAVRRTPVLRRVLRG